MEVRLEEFENYRHKMNDRIDSINHLGIKRFFNLDTKAYQDDALSAK
ncbi:MAG: Alkylhydroperoxidase, partial [Anaerolineaceae bacterium 46_22]